MTTPPGDRPAASTAEAGPSGYRPPAPAAATAEEEDSDDMDSLDDMLDPGTRLLMQRLQHRKDLHKVNILKSQYKQKEDFKKRHHGPAPEELMPPGSLVLLWCPAKTKMHKTSSIEGPYRLVKYLDNSRALLEVAQGKTWPAAINRLSPYSKDQQWRILPPCTHWLRN